jgi:hypothetical protein
MRGLQNLMIVFCNYIAIVLIFTDAYTVNNFISCSSKILIFQYYDAFLNAFD